MKKVLKFLIGEDSHEWKMRPLLLIAIAVATTLPPWMAVIQAAVCGASLGMRMTLQAVKRKELEP